MAELFRAAYPDYDKPEICRVLFHPRREHPEAPDASPGRLMIPVDHGVAVGGCIHPSKRTSPTILLFHGNGEMAADYDDIGALYQTMGINFLPVDYRGYGLSSGIPTVTTMMQDSRIVFAYVAQWLADRGFSVPVVVMGRSLGTAPAIEVALHNGEQIAGLIIESGFARIIPLLNLLGVHDPELTETSGPQNLEKIRQVRKPTLIIHAEYDQIIPLAEGKELYDASGADAKRLIEIPGADHNSIFFYGMRQYLEAIETFMQRAVMDRP